MEINIIRAKEKYREDCIQALSNSELSRVYFSNEEHRRNAIEEALTKGELYVAVNGVEEGLGFLWYIPNGAFHSFPYLHVIAVKEQYRSCGIGRKLLDFFEAMVAQTSNKAFLVVADFNPRAKQLYERIGYQEIGIIPDLYRPGVNECLMMKVIKK